MAADPASYDARESLVTFYIRAPGIVGGSMKKGYRNADAYAKIRAGAAAVRCVPGRDQCLEPPS